MDTISDFEAYVVSFVLGNLLVSYLLLRTKGGLVFRLWKSNPLTSKPEFSLFGYLCAAILSGVLQVSALAYFEIANLVLQKDSALLLVVAAIPFLTLIAGFWRENSESKSQGDRQNLRR